MQVLKRKPKERNSFLIFFFFTIFFRTLEVWCLSFDRHKRPHHRRKNLVVVKLQFLQLKAVNYRIVFDITLISLINVEVGINVEGVQKLQNQ